VLPGARLGTADLGGQVTVRHLLSHTSGIDGDMFTDTGRGDDCVERYVGLLAEVPSVFAPGATYSYCHSGYVVFGRIIEVIDGQTCCCTRRMPRAPGSCCGRATTSPGYRSASPNSPTAGPTST
jgi:Beta-lactamase